MKGRTKLPNVTLIAVAGNKQSETISSMYKSMDECDFGAVKLITNVNVVCAEIEVINVGGLTSWKEYNHFIIKELYKYFDTDYCLIVQWDSWVLNGWQWADSFLKYDIIGAKWMYPDERNVGNGGFSLRSKRLQEIIANDATIEITSPEDEVLGRLYRFYLEKTYDIKYAPEYVCDKFSFELNEPLCYTFGFHGFHHKPYKKAVIIKRTGALGDVVMAEPIMEYYHKKGYNVFVDTKAHYMNLFYQHNFPVKHISLMNPKLVKDTKVIDLDMSYEKTPKQLVLKSYYETCGVDDGEIRNAKLFSTVTGNNKLFRKYVVIHVDDTDMPHRNVYGVEWVNVIAHLKKIGYDVFQIGKIDHYAINGAIYFNSSAEIMLMYLLKGADFVIGIDSGVAQVSVALGVPAIIFFGSVNPAYRYADFSNIKVIQNKCDKAGCYHEVISTVGQPCFYNPKFPPCTNFTSKQVITAIKEIYETIDI